MPRIDEFPPHAQDALRAREAQASQPVAAEDPADKPRMSLLARLASVGLGRREEAHHEEPVSALAASVGAREWRERAGARSVADDVCPDPLNLVRVSSAASRMGGRRRCSRRSPL